MSKITASEQTELPFPKTWRTNALYDEVYLRDLIENLDISEGSRAAQLLDFVADYYNVEQFQVMNESALESAFISPLLKYLGWVLTPQVSIKVQGKFKQPDWGLLKDSATLSLYLSTKDDPNPNFDSISLLLEAKAYGIDLDKSKSKTEKSPHFQLMEYFQLTRKHRGFLTNGRFWRFYDVEKISQTKAYLEIDLETALAQDELTERRRAMALLYQFLAKENHHAQTDTQTAPIDSIRAAANDFASEAEENLKSVIYGTDGENSMFELIGKSIHERSPKAELSAVYDNAVIMLFRLLFIVYFEDKNRDLLAQHAHYDECSLSSIYESLQNRADDARHAERFDGFYALKKLFVILDEGAEDIDIPLFNGGLFDPERTPLLLPPKIFSNAVLRQILEHLLYKTKRGAALFSHKRDYKNMSVTHLGRIYEGLLEYTFEIASEDFTYLTYQIGNAPIIEAYFDAYDIAQIEKQKNYKRIEQLHKPKNSFILKSANNSRKSSASYYTPTVLSEFLVREGIDAALNPQNALNGAPAKKLIDLKIIDNACGSGHFLVEALNYLTIKGMAQLDKDPELRTLIDDEQLKIKAQIKSLNLADYEPEESQILKRALLKRCIFGVDLNPFAVELARLSLWIDSFIFGTPLSFIEHHIQHGNALMGSTETALNDLRRDFEANSRQLELGFSAQIELTFGALETAALKLNDLQDTSTADIKQSKIIYNQEVKPHLETLARHLSFVSMLDIQAIENAMDKVPAAIAAQHRAAKCAMFFNTTPKTTDKTAQAELAALHAEIAAYQRRHVFFHYDIAFPEAHGRFDVMIGNPPWDKTKFTDFDFFPRYSSNYRSLKNEAKQTLQDNLLNKPHIKTAFDAQARDMHIANEYYKRAFPLNKGAGDGNLFGFLSNATSCWSPMAAV